MFKKFLSWFRSACISLFKNNKKDDIEGKINMDYSVESIWKQIVSIVDDTNKQKSLQWNPLDEKQFKQALSLLFTEGDGYDASDFFKLKRHIVLDCVLKEISFLPYYRIIETITVYREKDIRFKSFERAKKEWIELLRGSWVRVQNNHRQLPEETIQSFESRSLHVAESTKRLQKEEGISAWVEEGRMYIDEDDMERVAYRIEKCIIDCGARDVFACILSHISRNYDHIQKRYHSTRSPQLGPRTNPLSPPFGYLIQLTLKHWGSTPAAGANQKALWNKALQLAFDLIAVEDCEQHSMFEIMLSLPRQLLRLLEDLAVFDTVCNFPQVNPDYLYIFIKDLFDWIDQDRFKDVLGFRLDDIMIFMQHILNGSSKNPHMPYLIDDILYSTLVSTLGNDKTEALFKWFTYSIGSANKEYLIPRDHRFIDSWFKPLFEDEDGNVWLPNASICFPGFYEATFKAVRRCTLTSECENKMGEAVERLLRTILKFSKVDVIYGDYSQNGVEGDIDCAYVDNDVIVLFEVKKKALTRAARSGSIKDILYDMALSIGKAFSQLYKHEFVLKDQGYIHVHNEDGKQSIRYTGQQIRHVVVTLLDFGGLADRNIHGHFLSTLLTHSIQATDDKDKPIVDKVNQIADDLRNRYKLLYPTGATGSDMLRNWALSIPYIILAINDRNSDTVIESIFLTKSISMGTCDIFRERTGLRRIRKKTDL
ncbi:MAG: hypothetical protein ACTSYJ_02375 [Candidatus Thorarchaeota archaeon]